MSNNEKPYCFEEARFKREMEYVARKLKEALELKEYAKQLAKEKEQKEKEESRD
jgi:hypothetical protein